MNNEPSIYGHSIVFPCAHRLVQAWCEHGRFERFRLHTEADKEIIKVFSKFEDIIHVESDGGNVTQVWPMLEWMRSLERQAKFRTYHERDRELYKQQQTAKEKAVAMLRALLGNADKDTALQALGEMIRNTESNFKILGLSEEEVSLLRNNKIATNYTRI